VGNPEGAISFMKKVALLIDGEWFRRRLEDALNGKLPNGVTADIMYKNAMQCVDGTEEIFRIFYYDCPPYDGVDKNPIDGSVQDFKTHAKYRARQRFLNEFKTKDYVAMRLGVAKQRGWTLTESYIKKAISGKHLPLCPLDVLLSVEQKGVDMRIGIDVASLSLKRIVERIILISGDMDMVPALKLARREGVQIVLVQVASPLAKLLDEDVDLVRRLVPSP
jgi:uncharacterized LabA/DUF88 family protein